MLHSMRYYKICFHSEVTFTLFIFLHLSPLNEDGDCRITLYFIYFKGSFLILTFLGCPLATIQYVPYRFFLTSFALSFVFNSICCEYGMTLDPYFHNYKIFTTFCCLFCQKKNKRMKEIRNLHHINKGPTGAHLRDISYQILCFFSCLSLGIFLNS